MSIPSKLDTFVTDLITITPTIKIDAQTKIPYISAIITKNSDGSIINDKLEFDDHEQYIKYVNEKIINPSK